MNRDLITPDYLWDYVLKVFQDDVTSYGAVTERYNSYINQVGNQGAPYMAVFKGILLLNAFNNISGENNNGLITPSKRIFEIFLSGPNMRMMSTRYCSGFTSKELSNVHLERCIRFNFPHSHLERLKRRRMKCAMCNSDIHLKFLISLMLPVSPLNNASCSG